MCHCLFRTLKIFNLFFVCETAHCIHPNIIWSLTNSISCLLEVFDPIHSSGYVLAETSSNTTIILCWLSTRSIAKFLDTKYLLPSNYDLRFLWNRKTNALGDKFSECYLNGVCFSTFYLKPYKSCGCCFVIESSSTFSTILIRLWPAARAEWSVASPLILYVYVSPHVLCALIILMKRASTEAFKHGFLMLCIMMQGTSLVSYE